MKKFKFKIISVFFMLTLADASLVVGVDAMKKNQNKIGNMGSVYKTNVLNEDENKINEKKFNKEEKFDEIFNEDDYDFNSNKFNRKKSDDEFSKISKKSDKDFDDVEILNMLDVEKEKDNYNNDLNIISEKSDKNSNNISVKSDDSSVKIFGDLDKSFNYDSQYFIENAKIFEYWNEFYNILNEIMRMHNIIDSKIKGRYETLCRECNRYVEKNIKKISDNDINIINSIINEINNRMEYPNYYNVKDEISKYKYNFNYILTNLMYNIISSDIKKTYYDLRNSCIKYVNKNGKKIDENNLKELSKMINEIDLFIENPSYRNVKIKILEYCSKFYDILNDIMSMHNIFGSNIKSRYEYLFWECNNYVEENINNISKDDLNNLNNIIGKIDSYFKI